MCRGGWGGGRQEGAPPLTFFLCLTPGSNVWTGEGAPFTSLNPCIYAAYSSVNSGVSSGEGPSFTS